MSVFILWVTREFGTTQRLIEVEAMLIAAWRNITTTVAPPALTPASSLQRSLGWRLGAEARPRHVAATPNNKQQETSYVADRRPGDKRIT